MAETADMERAADRGLDHDLLVSVMPDAAVVVGPDGTIVAANELVAAVFGYGSGELIGKAVEVLVPERRRHPHRQHRAEYQAAPRPRTMGAGLDLFGRRRDGVEVPVDVSLAPLPGGGSYVLAAIRDITLLRAAASTQANLVAVVESSTDGIISMSVEGVIGSWNSGAARVLGYDSDAVLGRHVSMLLFDGGSEELEILLAHATATDSIGPLDSVWRRADGTPVDVAISVSAIVDPAGDQIGFSAIVRDVTERKGAEAELRRLFREEQRRERWQAATSEIRLAMLSGTSLDDTLTLICEHARDLLEVESATIGFVEGDELAVAAASGPAVVSPAMLLESDVVRQTLAPGRAQPADATAGGAGRPSTDRTVVACAPIVLEDKVAGVLVADDEPAAEPHDELTPAVLEGLAEQAALARELGQAREARERMMLLADRERIGRDLHDLVIQRLFAAGMALQGSLRLVRDEQVASRVSSAIDALDATVREIRTVIFALEEPAAGVASVRSAILEIAAEVAAPFGFEPGVRFAGPVDTAVGDDVRPHLLAVVREALSNAARHSGATSIDVTTEVKGTEVVLTVHDDGIGIDPGVLDDRESGLANLRVRSAELGGAMEVSSEGGGTTLVWRAPIAAR